MMGDMLEEPPVGGDAAVSLDNGGEDHIRAMSEPVPEVPNPRLDRYLELLKDVQAAPTDFNAWSNLIAAAEKLDDLEKIVTVYDTFLASWPLCYGYWKKYADAEIRHGSRDRAIQVFERGVAATPYSIDLWVHYSNYQRSLEEATPDSVRSIFERALAAVGTDYLSHSIWDKYLAFEAEQGSKQYVAALYSRVIGVPLRNLDNYYNGLRNLVHTSQLQELMSEEEVAHLKSQLEAERKAVTGAATAAATAVSADATADAAVPAGEGPAVKTEAVATGTQDATAEAVEASVKPDAAAGDTDLNLGDVAIKTEEPAVEAQAVAVEPDSAAVKAEPMAVEAEAVPAGTEAVPANGDAVPVKAESAVEAEAVATEDVAVAAMAVDQQPADVDMAVAQPVGESEAAAVDATATDATAAAATADTLEQTTEPVVDMQNMKEEPSQPAVAEVAAVAEAIAEEVAVQPDVPVSEEDVKARWMLPRDQLYAVSAAELDNRRLFEESIKRTYFHVKPLDSFQLINWLKYLDYMESKGDVTSTMILYERCLVACASYPGCWERYVRWLEQQGYMEEAAGALQRATITFCRLKPEIHLFAMRFDERCGNVESARARYKMVLGELVPRSLSATVAAANFERRQGNREAACKLFEDLMAEEKARDDSMSKGTYAFLAMQYANFLKAAYKDHTKGREVLRAALEAVPHLKQLWEGAIFYEEASSVEDSLQVVLDLCARASAAAGSEPEGSATSVRLRDADREEFSLAAVAYAGSVGSAADLEAAERRHAQAFLPPAAAAAEARKRHAEATAAEAAARPPKVPRPPPAEAVATSPPPLAGPAPPTAPPPPGLPPPPAAYYGQAPAVPAADAPPAAAYPGYYPGYQPYPAAPYPAQYPAYGYGYQ